MAEVDRVRREIQEHDWRVLVAGELRRGSAAAEVLEDPATTRALTSIDRASVADVRDAVDAAEEAADGWRSTAPRVRARMVRDLAQALEENADELAWLDTLGAGLPMWMMRIDAATGVERMRLFADWAMELKGQTIPATATGLHLTLPEPFGVVARIIPFNHPFMFAASKLAAPLVAGNAVVLKPSDRTPLSALRLGELARDVIPPGVLSIVHGGPEIGDALVRDPRVRRVAFTGSAEVGRAIQRSGAESGVKHVTLELGGKNALIVFPDADLETVVKAAVKGMNFAFAGQSCGSTSRILVHESVAEEFTDRYVAAVEQLTVAMPWEEAAQVGPLVSRTQHERVLRHLDLARSEGAETLTGGGAVESLAPGYFVWPTVLRGVRPDHRIAQEEVFGPVVVIMTFAEEAEAVRVANQVEYGLTASVWTRDISRAHRVGRAVRAGYVWINDTSTHFLGVPFGGVKSSGIGREESFEELLSYTELKTINVVQS